jgi:protein-disulfide isomerase
MSLNPDSPVELREDQSSRDSQWSRGLLNGVGWLTLLAAIILAVRPSPSTIVDTSSLSGSTAPLQPNPAIGPADAPVTILEFGDFACPACGVWSESGIRDQVLEKYGDSVRFVWADFPSVTLDSRKAAEAARCAHDQEMFWEYHDYLYSHMEELSVNDLKLYATILGLDRTQFDHCLDSEARAAEVSIDFRLAVDKSVGVLPTFYVNDILLAGPPSFELLVSVIDPILAEEEDGQ